MIMDSSSGAGRLEKSNLGPSPATVRHGMNRSRSAVSEPMRAAMPSEITSTARRPAYR
jgi:hypothetical protein